MNKDKLFSSTLDFRLLITFFLIAFVSSNKTAAQNVGINATGTAPNASAGLDVNHTNKGVLLTRVALLSVTDVATIPSPAISLIVYNTTSNSLISPGFFYWNGTVWKSLIAKGGDSPCYTCDGF